MTKKPGQSLIELLIAIGLMAILLPALLTAVVASTEGRAQSQQRTEATNLQKEAEEALRIIREASWQQINSNGTFHPIVSGSSWTLAAGSEVINGYTRKIEIMDTQRDAAGNIATFGTADPSTKKIVTTVSWTTPINSQVDSTAYFSRYLSNNNLQETTQAQFASGTLTNTQAVNNSGGEIQLTQASSTAAFGNEFQVTATSSIGSMTSINHKTSIRFTAQNTKTVNAIRVYLQAENGASPSYRFGLQANSGTSPSGTFLGSGTQTNTSVGWKTIPISPSVNITSGSIYHIVIEPVGTPTGSANIALRRSTPLNGLYPLNQAIESQANTLFKTTAAGAWTVQNFQPIYELDFTDSTYEGNPFDTVTATSVFGTNYIGEKISISGGNKTATAISFFVSQNSATEPLGPLDVELRDSNNSVLSTGTLATAAQTNTTYTYFTYTFPTSITLASGSTYRIFLRSPLSNATNFYRVNRVTTTNATNFNSITYDGTNSVYTTSANSGSTWTDTNVNWDIGGYYFDITTAAGYSPSGTFQSQTKDAGSTAAFNNIRWVSTTPAGTAIQFQVAINTDNSTWNFFGPDATPATFYTSSGSIPLTKINGRYIRYKGFFTSDGISTPTLSEINFNYSP